MPRISIDDVKAWVESTKLNPQAIDVNHCIQIEEEVLARIASVYDTSLWTDRATTPKLVQVIIAKMYAGWTYDKFYSENQTFTNQYSQMVKSNAKALLDGILDGTIEIPGAVSINPQSASFYPNDASSAQPPTLADPSLGPAKFSLGRTF